MATASTCVLCHANPASRHGEHVWPSWYLRDGDKLGPTPSAWTHNGETIVDRNEVPVVVGPGRMRVMLPVCADCNNLLEKRFESPTKNVLRALFAAAGAVELGAADAAKIGEWFAKTWLLLQHPQVRYAHPRVNDTAIRLETTEMPPNQYYDWLISTGPPPAGLSIWVHRSDPTQNGPALHRVPLPRVTAAGETRDFLEIHVSLHGLCVTLVAHPGWPIEHPLQADGSAVRLLPAPGHGVDLRALPVLSHNAISWTRCYVDLHPYVLGSPALPPLRASQELFGVLPEVLPFVARWSG